MVEFFKDLSFFILPLGFGCKRIDFFETQIRKFGGNVDGNSRDVTHVVIEDSVCGSKEACLSALKNVGLEGRKNVKYVKVKWLSKCLSRKALVSTTPFEIEWMKEEEEEEEEGGRDSDVEEGKALEKRKGSEDIVDSKEEDEKGSPGKKQKVENYTCSMPSSSSQKETSSMKKKIIEELDKLAKAYTARNDSWRSYSYQKAMNAIMLYDKDISTFQEACKIPGIGEKMASKIMEIIESGRLSKIDEILDEKTKILDTFSKIWGVGFSTAEAWYVQGFRTLDDLRANAKLTNQQQVGLRLYDDLQKRIPREEVLEITDIVRGALSKIHGNVSMEVVGSFRRGKPTCGDVDIMIVNPGIVSPVKILAQITDALKAQGYLTDDLVSSKDLDTSDEENHHKKYFGIFKMPGVNQTHRRIDLFVVPKSEYASALMHYTGSAMFNRHIRLLAAKKGMTLTGNGLYAATTRKGSEVKSKGELVSTPTEEDIFKELGLPYRHPEERDY